MKRRARIISRSLVVAVGFVLVLLGAQRYSATRRSVVSASQALRSGDSDRAAKARRSLQDLGARALPILTERLTQKQSALQKLRRRVSPTLPFWLRANLRAVFPPRDPFAEKLDALTAMALLGTNAAAAVPALELTLQDPELSLAWAAAGALSRMGSAGLPPLVRCLQNTNPVVRRTGCFGLGIFETDPSPAVTNLIALLSDPEPSVRASCADALYRVGDPSMPALAAATLSADLNIRTGSIQVLLNHHYGAAPGVPTIVAACAHPDSTVRQLAASAIGQVWPWNTNAIGALTRLLDDPEQPVRLEAARALARCALRAEPAIPTLTGMLRDPSPEIREAAALSFTRMGALARPIVSELERLSTDESEAVRTAASNSAVAIRAASEPSRVP